jgi:flagellar hook-length control protein FliK
VATSPVESEASDAAPRASAQRETGKTSEQPARSSFERLVQSIRTSMGARESQARIRLDPPELGHVRIDLKVTGGRVALRLETETHEARALLSSRLDELRSALAQHGLTVDRVEMRELTPPGASTFADPQAAGQGATLLDQQARPNESRGRSNTRYASGRIEARESGDSISTATLASLVGPQLISWNGRIDIKA